MPLLALYEALKTGLEHLLDVVLPLRARAARTKSRRLEDIPLRPAEHDLLGERITTVMEYRTAAVQDLVRALKYDGSLHAATLAAQALADFLREEIASGKAFSPREVLLVPVPLHSSRKRERGFNQIELVLRALPKEFKDGTLARFAPEVLVRLRATGPQTKLPRRERIKNVVGAFACPDAARLAKTHVFLVDDVTTTGATLVNAAAPLRKAGARVSLLALARA
jgi:ComF family protein